MLHWADANLQTCGNLVGVQWCVSPRIASDQLLERRIDRFEKRVRQTLRWDKSECIAINPRILRSNPTQAAFKPDRHSAALSFQVCQPGFGWHIRAAGPLANLLDRQVTQVAQ